MDIQLQIKPVNKGLGAALAHTGRWFLYARMLFQRTELYGHVWETIVPATVLTMLILCFTFLGDGIRDAVDPRMNN